MARTSRNLQLFALRKPPPAGLEVAGRRYRLVRVFKHDFFAATCLYEAPGPAEFPRIVVKLGREQAFCGLPMAWYARMMGRHEEAIYRALAGVPGVPRWVGRIGRSAYAIEHIHARPLDHLDAPPEGFFDRLREVLDAIHARGVGYCDANKRSNILVGPGGEPYLVDYQISIRRRDELPWPLRNIVAAVVDYVAERDIYHLYKHKRRLSPAELTPEQEAISRRRSALHALHRKLIKPWHVIRRAFLRKQYGKGALKSPTADLEDHRQPEKATWRPDDRRAGH